MSNNSAIHWNLVVNENFNNEKWQQVRTTVFETIRTITKSSMLSMVYSERLADYHNLIAALNRDDEYSQFLLDECNRFMNEFDLEKIGEESQTLTEAILLIKQYKS